MDNNLVIFHYRDNDLTLNDIMQCMESGAYSIGLENGLQDLKDNCTTAQFSVILQNVGSYIHKTQALYLKPDDPNAGYNKQFIEALANIYIYLCNIYDKRICITYFQYFIGVNGWYLQDEYRLAAANNNALNSLSSRLRKRFKDADNDLQLSKARDSKQAILNLAYNNYEHSWTGQIKENEIKTTVKTLDDIKRERLEKSARREQITQNDDL